MRASVLPETSSRTTPSGIVQTETLPCPLSPPAHGSGRILRRLTSGESSMALDQDWFTEVMAQTGTAFSLRLGERVHEEKTPYQHIEIFRTDTFGYLMV